MITVSKAFKDKIYSQERHIKANVAFEIINVESYEDASLISSSEFELSRRDQVMNRRREMTHKYATFERDYFLLDGTYHLPPRKTEGNYEVGWWSDDIADLNGDYPIPPFLEYNFSAPHDSIGMTITFDKLTGEYPSDFILDIYDSAGALILSENVVGNTKTTYEIETPISGYQRVVLNIIKWAKPFRRARVVEVDFGLVKEYSGDKLISLRAIEEIDLLSSTVPSNEMEFVLDNSDNLFNLLNPDGIYHYLKPKQLMSAELGLELDDGTTEFVPLGRYFLDEWIVEEGGMTATFVGRDYFTQFDAIMYTNLLQNTNLYDLAVDIFAQIDFVDYQIHEELKNIATNGFKEPINVREALQMVAIAGKAVIRQDRNGFIVIDQIEQLAFETGYITFAGDGHYAGMTTPTVTQDYTFQAITFENAFETPQVKLAPAVTHLVFKLEKVVLNADGTETIEEYDYKIVNSQVKSGLGFEINNPLINTEAQALDVAEWMFREYSYIAEYFVNWRQNPALETGDILYVQDRFGSEKKARITKSEINYSGYLEGMTEAKGGI